MNTKKKGDNDNVSQLNHNEPDEMLSEFSYVTNNTNNLGKGYGNRFNNKKASELKQKSQREMSNFDDVSFQKNPIKKSILKNTSINPNNITNCSALESRDGRNSRYVTLDCNNAFLRKPDMSN